jgi:hypothetical protein
MLITFILIGVILILVGFVLFMYSFYLWANYYLKPSQEVKEYKAFIKQFKHNYKDIMS